MSESNLDLSGRVVIVTGGSGLVGTSLVQVLVQNGAAVVATTRQPKGPSNFPVRSDRLVWITADLNTEAGVEKVVETALSQPGRLYGLVNNAASQTVTVWDDTDTSDWRGMLETNLVSVHRLTKVVAEAIHSIGPSADSKKQAGKGGSIGSIVQIGSIEGVQPNANHADYSVSKAALIAYTKAASNQYGSRGIRVNCLSPGLVERPGIEQDWPEGVARYRQSAPLGRLVTGDEIAHACLFLLSGLAGAITGVNLVVDGGALTSPSW